MCVSMGEGGVERKCLGEGVKYSGCPCVMGRSEGFSLQLKVRLQLKVYLGRWDLSRQRTGLHERDIAAILFWDVAFSEVIYE